MQIIIPKFEIKRLIDLYKNHEIKDNFNEPDLIILENSSQISEYSIINGQTYCRLNEYKFLRVYIKKNDNKCNF